MSSPTPNRARKIAISVIALVLALLICGVLYDLYFPRTTHLREFDPDEVARLETAMWRSYYEKQRLRLFNQLSELLRTQYHMPLVRSNATAYYAANAAFVFKQGKQRADYEKALPDLVKFYGAIRQMSDIPFDVDRTARLELEWWIIHRQRALHPPGDPPVHRGWDDRLPNCCLRRAAHAATRRPDRRDTWPPCPRRTPAARHPSIA